MPADHPSQRMRISAFVPTLVGCTAALWVASAPVQAGMLLAFIPLLLVWLIYGLVVAVRRPKARVPLLIKLGLWAMTGVGVCVLFAHHLETARVRGEQVVQVVQAHRLQHGAWPTTMAEVGITEDERRKLRVHYVLDAQGQPFLMYSHPVLMFDRFVYDFEHHRWDYRPD